MTEVRQAIIQNIKEVCRVKKIKNVDIAEYMGVSAGSVSNWFKGTNFLDVDNLYKLCGFLGVSMDQIFGVKPIHYCALDEEESRLLSSYRAASREARGYAMDILEKSAAERQEKGGEQSSARMA